MDHEVQPVPHLAQFGEGGIQRGGVGDIAVDHGGRLHRLGQRHHALLEQIALIGEGQLRTRFMQSLGDTPGDGVLVGHAHDKAAFALHEPLK